MALSDGAAVPYVHLVFSTPTNRFYPLPDGRVLTWSQCAMTNATGNEMTVERTHGHVDGQPVPDQELRELLAEFAVS